MANLTGSRSNFPNNVDQIRELTDLPANKKVQAQRYQFLKTKKVLSPSEVTELNNLTTELQDYLITAESMNMFGDVVISTQKFFKENVMDFVLDKKQEMTTYTDNKKQEMTTYTDNKKVEFQAEVDKLNNRGDYNPSVQYFKNNFVFYNDGAINHVYLCLEDCTGKEPNTNPDFWRKLSIQGAKGDDGIGIGLSFNGSWDKSKLYAKDDGVQYGGILFASLVDNNIDNLPDLTQDTDYWARALDVTITVKKLIGVRNLVSQANTINFMTGEIVAFNKNIDSLEVYQNSVRLTKGVHYNIGLDGQSITKVKGSWDATVLNPIFFEFVVTRNQIGNDLIFSDGQSVANGTITRNKLDVDTQAKIGKIDDIENQAGKIGTKEVDETNIQDNYTIRYDADENKIVWVESKIDRTPPSPVTDITIKTDDMSAIINYIPPTDEDYVGTRLVYKIAGYPTGINDGSVVGNYVSGATITGLTNGTEYFFRLFPYDLSNNYNDDISQQISGIPSEFKIYGVKIDTLNSNPETAVTYTDHAMGFTPMSGNNGNFQWGSWETIFSDLDIKPCMFKSGVVEYYLNPNDYTKKTDGTNADITTGNDGDVMIEFGKPIYWKFETVGTDLFIRWSTEQVDAGYKALAHTVGATLKDKIYISAYMGYSLSSKLRSLSGKVPTVNQTIGAFRTLAKANGANYNQMPYYPLLMLQVLFIVMFKSRDSQTALGRGYVDGNSALIATGGANAKGMFYGETTGKQQLKFCGIEDWYGNAFYWIDGFFSDANRNMLISNQSVFNDNGSGYTNHGQGATANLNGYVGTVQGGTETGFVIKTSTGSATTLYADYGALIASCLPVFGGYWSDGDNAGAFYLQVNYSASSFNSGISARLAAL